MDRDSCFLLDTSDFLALRGGESGSDEVEQLLRQAETGRHQLLASFMTRMELLYLIGREESEEAARHALRMIDTFSLEWASCGDEILEAAAGLKAGGGLSVAESWIGATAVVYNATLIHKNPEFLRFRQIRRDSSGHDGAGVSGPGVDDPSVGR